MWGIALRFWREIRGWPRPQQRAARIALVILALAIAAALFGPRQVRAPALIGAFGAIVSLQALIMWSLIRRREQEE